jgi:hypothetical protein
MRFRLTPPLRIAAAGLLAVAGVLALVAAFAPRLSTPRASAAPIGQPFCANHAALCAERTNPWDAQGQYSGHDEPSLLFYSGTAGSGNTNHYQFTMPSDPPTPPNQAGTGGTWNFQLRPTFWFGMALCDDQSGPNVGGSSVGAQLPCTPNSDANIFTGTTPGAPDYLGLTPGTAFMEMQFYPPGWGNVGTGISCGPDNTHWCSAMNIDSDSANENTGVANNTACLSLTGEEYVNFALITKSGLSQAPADPLRQTAATFTTGADTLTYNSGDQVTVDMHDTPAGFQIAITDLTSGQSGSMTASTANGFGHPLYQPSAKTCSDEAYAFHPMFATSSERTRVLWAAHSYNVAFSDEIGHFEYCAKVNTGTKQTCGQNGVTDPGGNDGDEAPCFNLPVVTTTQTLPNLSGCTGTDSDFDGPEYANNWPGTLSDGTADASLHATPVRFTSPLFTRAPGAALKNYDRVAFETDLPRVEFATNPPCQRHVFNPADPSPGAGCVNPPVGAGFYPFYSTTTSAGGGCVWQEGGNFIPGTTNNFGGSSATEFGGLLVSVYPRTGPGVQGIYENFHNTLSGNPCQA